MEFIDLPNVLYRGDNEGIYLLYDGFKYSQAHIIIKIRSVDDNIPAIQISILRNMTPYSDYRLNILLFEALDKIKIDLGDTYGFH